MKQPTLAGIREAQARLRPYLPETPLMRSDILSRALDAEVWLKNETITPIASFKFRGALNAMIKAKSKGTSGAVTSSTGNHGQGVAYAARVLDLRADIFLPSPANSVKATMIKIFGGTLHEIGDDIDEAKDADRQFTDDHGHWDPWRCAVAALLFGAVDALQLRLQSGGVIDLPYQIFLMLPFVVTVAAMAVLARNARPPAALLIPYRKEER